MPDRTEGEAVKAAARVLYNHFRADAPEWTDDHYPSWQEESEEIAEDMAVALFDCLLGDIPVPMLDAATESLHKQPTASRINANYAAYRALKAALRSLRTNLGGTDGSND